ncbi:MAG: MBL fold metallo-hydrolase [Burkholderiaceae bacterium]|nr:MBL fold metallo-hydrolase [Burkholderiaceae bacterium]
MIASRILRSAILAMAGFSAVALVADTALAAAPLSQAQAPGFYRTMVGSIEVTVLSDGTVQLPVADILTGAKPGEVAKALSHNYLKSPLETSFNAFLINTGSKLVLVDTGAGHFFGPTLGNLTANLKAAGYAPEQVDEIYITHFHGDHIGGLIDNDGKAVFSNAVVRADKHESDYFLSKANLDKASADEKSGFQHAQEALGPYVSTGHFKAIESDGELVPGVSSRAAYGHTPGHTTYVVQSNGQKLTLIGDLMHVASVQFPDPSVTIKFDSDTKQAAVQRKKLYAEAAKDGGLIGGAHLSFPGLGRLRTDGKGYDWIPLNYSPVKPVATK